MRVLMFGWEFPPFSTGGLGTACEGLTKGLLKQGAEVLLVLPKSLPNQPKLVIKSPADYALTLIEIKSNLMPYSSMKNTAEYGIPKSGSLTNERIYGHNLWAEVQRFTELAQAVAKSENYDIIHCHDWMTFPAGIIAKKISHKQLIVHVHATEFDRSGGSNMNQGVYEIEKQGMDCADKIICVSYYTKRLVIKKYGIHDNKIAVVHNAVEFTNAPEEIFEIKKQDKIVLFLGRLTLQKGPDYFIKAAKKVLEKEPNTKFIVAGHGDMLPWLIQETASLGIGDKVLFTGFLSRNDVDRAFKMADVYVMPSVSEPFGITPLEAMRNRTPVIISKQSGVSEVIKHCLRVDFWDIEQLSEKIIALLRYKPLNQELAAKGHEEVKKFSWNVPAKKCIKIYRSLIRKITK